MAINVTRQQKQEASSTPRGIQFLSPRHTTEQGRPAKIVKVTTPDNGGKPDNYGNPYVVYFVMDGVKYSKGYKETSDALISMVDLFGTDESKWAGQSLVIAKQVDEDGGERLIYKAPAKGKGK